MSSRCRGCLSCADNARLQVSTEIVVRFAETDAQGIAHHASFVVWFEVARVAYLSEHAGGYLAIQAQGIEALTTEVNVRYHRAAYFDDRLRVWTRCVDLRGARFRYEYAVERDGETRSPRAGPRTRPSTRRRAGRSGCPPWFVDAVARAESSSSAASS